MQTTIIESSFELSTSHLNRTQKIDKLIDYIIDIESKKKQSDTSNIELSSLYSKELEGARRMINQLDR